MEAGAFQISHSLQFPVRGNGIMKTKELKVYAKRNVEGGNKSLSTYKIIRGLKEVLIGMKDGGKRRALIPPLVGYITDTLQPIPEEGFFRGDLLQSMAEENAPRSKGVVLRFNDQKGYGFIQPEGDDDDLFVHQTAIKHDGYRTLREGQVVEFTIILDGDKTKAIDVTAPGGGPVDSPPRRGNNNGLVDRRNNGDGFGYRMGGGGGGGKTCYECGNYGHMARECVNGGGGGAGGVCYNCGGVGHLARDCPSEPRGGGGGSRTCYKCGAPGHLARNCSVAEGGNGGGSGYSRGGVEDRTCYKCGEPGHLARECVVGDGSGDGGDRRGNSRGGGSSRKFEGGRGGNCYNCGGPGHFARDCEADPLA